MINNPFMVRDTTQTKNPLARYFCRAIKPTQNHNKSALSITPPQLGEILCAAIIVC